MGWVYQYIVLGAERTLAELRTIQDWYLRYQLTKAEGVAEGEKVVVGANFLIDAESNLRAALQNFAAPQGQGKSP